jgi:protein-tyrosine-phosphatase
VEVASAGSVPAADVHPLAREILQTQYSIDTSSMRPKSVQQFVGERFDYVITVCDLAAENCPVFPGAPQRIHWSFEDPAAVADAGDRRRAFAAVAAGLSEKLRAWLAQPDVRAKLDNTENASPRRHG